MKKRGISDDRVHTQQVASTPSSSDVVVTPGASVAQDAPLNIAHLKLLHHFTTVTAETLAYSPEAAHAYQTYIVKLAFEFPFLLQGVLALSALHLSRVDPAPHKDYLDQAARHHDAALLQFRTEIVDIDETNFKAVLAFSSMLYPYSCAFGYSQAHPIDSSFKAEQALNNMLQNIVLTRRVRPLVEGRYDEMIASELNHIIPEDAKQLNWHADPAETTDLVKLRKFAELTQNLYPEDISKAYAKAIRSLETVIHLSEELAKPPSDSLLKAWLHSMTERFVELLSERQPGALIIFAHFAVLFKRSSHYWFFDGLAEQVLQICEIFVPSEWSSWLEWPREQISA